MPFKYIVRIQKNGIPMEVETMATNPREAQQNVIRMHPGYTPTGIQWRIEPKTGQRILSS